jgi:hypothetical protein
VFYRNVFGVGRCGGFGLLFLFVLVLDGLFLLGRGLLLLLLRPASFLRVSLSGQLSLRLGLRLLLLGPRLLK